MELSTVFMIVFFLVLTVLIVAAWLTGYWMKKDPQRKDKKCSSNVVSINDIRYRENIKLFLESEDSLTNNDFERYAELRAKAVKMAKVNLAS